MTLEEFEKIIAESQYKWIIRKHNKADNKYAHYSNIYIGFYNLYGTEQHLLTFYYDVELCQHNSGAKISEGSVTIKMLKPLMSVDGYVCDVETDEYDENVVRFSKVSKFEPYFRDIVLQIKKLINESRKTDMLCDFD